MRKAKTAATRETRHARAAAGREGGSVPVVAIGASAGGLEAVSALLIKLSSNSGMAFVVIQHLDPARLSTLRRLLSKTTSLPVLEISNGIALRPDHVYVIPPNKRASMRDGSLSLGPVKREARGHLIDDFMVDLAKMRGDGAIGIVLSGTGSDGTRGIGAIKAAGGITFAQKPKTARWPAMPLSAIAAGFVDFILSPPEIALELGRLGRYAYKPPGLNFASAQLDKIVQILHTATGIDFRRYKQPTVVRRILRQMTIQGMRTLTQYARLLRGNPKETEFLADRIFIPLTGFFRDPGNFQALRRFIRSELLTKRQTEPLRVWVAGCSTGEEAYSIAMLLVEELGPAAKRSVQIFATDIRQHAIEFARAAMYSEAAVAGVTPKRLKRFFVKSEDGYRVKPELRNLCVFAQHDLTRDPPFSKLDLISCRNVLPYLRSAFQEQALIGFHYALKPRSFLLTDVSIATKASSHFALKDLEHGIFWRKPNGQKTAGRSRSLALYRRKSLLAMIPTVTARSVTRVALEAANEQLSAANQELETANEELRASYQENIALGDELRNSNTALKALANDLGTLLTGADIPVLVLDSRLRIVRFTLAAATLFHLTSSHEGAPFLRAASNLGELPWETLLADMTRHGQPVERTFQHRNSHWYSVRMKPFGGKENAIGGVLVVLLDENTVRRALIETLTSLEESESIAHALFDASPEGIFAVDSAGSIVWANETTAKMFGYEASELPGRSLDLLVPEHLREQLAANQAGFVANPRTRPLKVGMNLQGRHKDGTLFPIEVGLGSVDTRTGLLAVAFVTDTTERKELGQSIRQRESELAALIDSSPDPHARWDSNLRFTYANAAFAKLGELPQGNVRVAARLIKDVFRTGEPQRAEFTIPGPEGAIEHEVRYVPELAPEGSVAAVLAIGRDITEMKQMERDLRHREQELATLFDNSPDVILRLDRNLRNLYINSAWERATGISRETALGKTSRELGLPPDVVSLQERVIRQVLKTRSPVTVEFTYPSPGGQVVHEVRHIPEFTDGAVSSILLIGRDITEQKRLETLAVAKERERRESEGRFRRMADSAPVLIWMSGDDKLCTWCNQQWLTFVGRTMAQELGNGWTDSIHPEDLDRCFQTYTRHFDAREPFSMEYRLRRNDGEWRWILDSGAPRYDPLKNFAGYIGTCIDITALKVLQEQQIIAERKLRERDQELAVLFDSSPDSLVRFDSNMRATHVNAAFERMTGIPVEAVVGKTSDQVPLPKDIKQAAAAVVRNVFLTRQQGTLLWSFNSPRGVRDLDLRYIPEFAADGSVSAVFSIARDVTEKKRAEEALLQRERELATLFDHSPDVISRRDRNFRALYLNAAWEKMTGIAREKGLGKSGRELGYPPEFVDVQERLLRRVLKSKRPLMAEFSYPSPTGLIELEVRHVPELAADGSVSSVLLIGRDVTEQKRLQTLAAANQRDIHALTTSLMTAQEQERRRVARDIHDSLSQHLGALAAEMGGIAAELPASSRAGQHLRIAREHALRVAEEARQIARQLHPAILEDLGLTKGLQNLCDEFSYQQGIPIQFRVTEPFPVPSIEAASCMYRIAQEVLNNVAKHAQAKNVSVQLTGKRSQLRLSIRDNGIGFDPAAVRGAGGLGLVSMEERARMAGAKLSIRARPGNGTQVDLVVPLQGTAHEKSANSAGR